MLMLYPIPHDLNAFCQGVYEEHRAGKNQIGSFDLDYDFLLLNEEKYTVADINNYIEFFQTKALEKTQQKIAIIANFDLIDRKIQNKLLKTFEEQDNIQIILTNKITQILPTILSRAIIIDKNKNQQNFDKYPERYQKLLNVIEITNIENEESQREAEKYIKFYEHILNNRYADAYIMYTTVFNEDNVRRVYEIIQIAEASKKSSNNKLEILLNLQEYLSSKSNGKFHIENYLLQETGE